jgi:hypothetical protein
LGVLTFLYKPPLPCPPRQKRRNGGYAKELRNELTTLPASGTSIAYLMCGPSPLYKKTNKHIKSFLKGEKSEAVKNW